MRTMGVVVGLLVTVSLLSGCVSEEIKPAPVRPVPSSGTSTPTPTPSIAPSESPDAVQAWAPTCENIIPANEVANLREWGYQPEATTYGDDRINETFFANGGIFCIWTHPQHMDSLPNYGYSQISVADSREMQNQLGADHESFISGEFAGFKSYVLNGGGHLAYLFADGALYAAPTNEEAMLVIETVANAQ